jgi:hypothetical protein
MAMLNSNKRHLLQNRMVQEFISCLAYILVVLNTLIVQLSIVISRTRVVIRLHCLISCRQFFYLPMLPTSRLPCY